MRPHYSRKTDHKPLLFTVPQEHKRNIAPLPKVLFVLFPRNKNFQTGTAAYGVVDGREENKIDKILRNISVILANEIKRSGSLCNGGLYY